MSIEIEKNLITIKSQRGETIYFDSSYPSYIDIRGHMDSISLSPIELAALIAALQAMHDKITYKEGQC
jgi:hypothetical protein